MNLFFYEIQAELPNPGVFNPNKNSLGTKYDCILFPVGCNGTCCFSPLEIDYFPRVQLNLRSQQEGGT